MIEQGADVHARRTNGWTPPLAAAQLEPIVDLLLRTGANPDLASSAGYAPLMRASGHGSVKITEQLLAAGAFAPSVSFLRSLK